MKIIRWHCDSVRCVTIAIIEMPRHEEMNTQRANERNESERERTWTEHRKIRTRQTYSTDEQRGKNAELNWVRVRDDCRLL